MKLLFKIFLCASLLLCSCFAARAAPKSLHHDLQVSLFPSQNRMTATDRIKVDPDQAIRLSFHLSKRVHVSKVEVNSRPVSYEIQYGSLHIPLETHQRHNVMTVSITYEGVFDDPIPQSPANTDDPSYGVTGIISEKGCFLQSGSGWYPEMPGDSPTYRLLVDAPEGILAVTVGRRVGHEARDGRTLSTWEVKHPVEGLSLSAARYVVQEKAQGHVKAATYFFPGTTHLAEAYLDATIRYMSLYEKLFGPYPFDRFAVVENFFPTGYGFPSYTLLGSRVIRLPFIMHTSLGHEIAHCWWGNGVFVDHEHGNWSEALTTYVADYLYKERASFGEARDYRLQILRKFATLVTAEKDFPLRDFQGRYDPASQAIGYGKGAMVFHMLRQRLGDDLFWKALRDVFRERVFQKTSWKDFQETFERSCHCSLQTFFDQWLTRKGAPQLSLERVQSIRKANSWQVSGLLVQRGPLYSHRLDIALESRETKVRKRIMVSNRETPFQIVSDGPPERLIVDPDFDNFRGLYPPEIPPSINSLKGSPSILIVLSKHTSPGIEKAVKTLTLSLGLRRFQIVPEDQLDQRAILENDLIIVGVPERKGLFSHIPPQVKVWESGFALTGRVYSHPSAAFFGVFEHSSAEGRVMALFLSLSPEYAEEVARKVTHYGKYSYLVFSQGRNEVREIWPISDSPLIYQWKR